MLRRSPPKYGKETHGRETTRFTFGEERESIAGFAPDTSVHR